MKKVLIGSCGGVTGLYLSKLFRTSIGIECELWGLDAESAFATEQHLDKFCECPKSTNKDEFITFLIDFVNSNGINYYLPTHSLETRTVSEYENIIRANSETKFIVSPYETYRALDNKRNCTQSFKRIGLNVPKIYCDNEAIDFPVFAKPEIGSGSKGSFFIHSIDELLYYRKKEPTLLVMENLKGKEYTVDVVFDNEGALITYNQRIRLKQQSGATIYTRNDFQIDVYDDLVNISKYYICKGVVNLQFFLVNGEAYYTDVNLRYASGGLPLSVESGIDLAKLLIELMDGNHIDRSLYQSDRKNRIMYRFYDERFDIL